MMLILKPVDVAQDHKDRATSMLGFDHFTQQAKLAIIVGSATYYNETATNYNVICPPLNARLDWKKL